MGREVRRVPLDWEHPTEERNQWSTRTYTMELKRLPVPLLSRDILKYYEPGEELPGEDELMPEFPEGTATGWCMYESTSEGTPLSPVFETPEELGRWLADNEASAFGHFTATYEQWMGMIVQGWSPSAVSTRAGVQSGVAFVSSIEKKD